MPFGTCRSSSCIQRSACADTAPSNPDLESFIEAKADNAPLLGLGRCSEPFGLFVPTSKGPVVTIEIV